MTSLSPDEDLQALWQSQPPDNVAMSLQEIRSRARRLEQRVARRNLRESVAGVIVIAFYGSAMWVGPSVAIRFGAALIIAATVFIVWRLRTRSAAMPVPADLALSASIDLYRLRLEQQRDLLHGVWLWYLLPLVPGILVLAMAMAFERPDRMWQIGAWGIVAFGGMVGGHLFNRRAAAGLQRRIDALDRE